MQIVRSPQLDQGQGHAHSELRYSVLLPARVFRTSEEPGLSGLIRNISAGGAMAELSRPDRLVGSILVSIRNYGTLSGTVAWQSGLSFGVTFVEPLDLPEFFRERARTAQAPSMIAHLHAARAHALCARLRS